MYIFTHESDMLIPGTQHKLGAAHALEIPYKFNLVRPDQNSEANRPGPNMMAISDPACVAPSS
jgi:para-nitrobenzyl esterase